MGILIILVVAFVVGLMLFLVHGFEPWINLVISIIYGDSSLLRHDIRDTRMCGDKLKDEAFQTPNPDRHDHRLGRTR